MVNWREFAKFGSQRVTWREDGRAMVMVSGGIVAALGVYYVFMRPFEWHPWFDNIPQNDDLHRPRFPEGDQRKSPTRHFEQVDKQASSVK